MKSEVQFRFHLFRHAFIPVGAESPTIDLLPYSGDACASLDATDETAALRWIAGRSDLLSLLLAQLGISGPVCVDVAVTKPFVARSGHGDIDLVATPEKDPRLAIALQAKRFKVKLRDSSETVSLDEEKIDDLIRQCNETLDLGFSQVYGLILVMTDGRDHPAASLLHRGASAQTFRRLYHFVKRRSLDWRVGVVFVQLVQPTPASFNDLGFFAVGVDQFARPGEQTGTFSEVVAKWSVKVTERGKMSEICVPVLRGEPVPIHANDAIGLRLLRRYCSQ